MMASKYLGILICVYLFGQILSQIQSGLPCINDGDCPSNASCNNNLTICECNTGYVLRGDWTKCLEVQVVPYDEINRCEEDNQCTPWMNQGAICSEGKCVCKDGYHYLHGRCYLSLGLDKDCEVDDDCYASYSYEALTCGSNKTCECANGFYRVDKYETCHKEGKKEGDECMFDIDCRAPDLYCKTNIGQCVKNTTNVNKTIESKAPQPQGIEVGSTCTNDIECLESMECFLDKCVCKPGYSNYYNYCLSDIGESCKNSFDCAHITHTECGSNNKCRCRLPYVAQEDNRKCRPGKRHGIRCNVDEQCMFLGEGVSCRPTNSPEDTYCLCRDGYHYVESIQLCVRDQGLGKTCFNDHDCIVANSTCSQKEYGYCECSPDYHENNGKCLPNVKWLGDYCATSTDCVKLANSECVNNTCICASGYFQDDDNVTCLLGLRGECSNDIECKAVNSICQEGKCACTNKTTASSNNNKCLFVGVKGSKCEEDVQCVEKLGEEGGGCVDGECGCKDGYHHRNNYCWNTRYVGDSCERNDQCFLKSGLMNRVNCENGFCKCDYQYQQTVDLECRSGVGRDSASAAVTGLFLLIAVLNVRDGWTTGRP